MSVLLDDRRGLMLDPIDTEVLLATDAEGPSSWLEFHLPTGAMATVEECR